MLKKICKKKTEKKVNTSYVTPLNLLNIPPVKMHVSPAEKLQAELSMSNVIIDTNK